jgi:hypothetical protein
MVIGVMFAAGARVGTPAQKSAGGPNNSVNSKEMAASAAQKVTGTPSGTANSTQKMVAVGEDYTKRLLLLMDTDKNGKVSKKEFMAFMDAEFDRLDTNHDGELDVKELAKLRVLPYLGR